MQQIAGQSEENPNGIGKELARSDKRRFENSLPRHFVILPECHRFTRRFAFAISQRPCWQIAAWETTPLSNQPSSAVGGGNLWPAKSF